MIRRPPRSTHCISSAASDVYKRQGINAEYMGLCETLIKGAFSSRCVNEVFNIGGEDYSLKEMAELIAGKYSVGIDHVEWPEIALKIETGDTVFDDTKLQSVIGNTVRSKFKDWVIKQQLEDVRT
eukprot:TRINITY_DN13977_c0_g1_i2.p4 TRINITY_DN13977_c0_g1~~TRINITY_DN13977_c0_g1_i2.p4  ORF type:complete len:125 (+),score=35.90 TRINITY_DN13977_c0_g1_i2:98-472(+)